MNALKQPKVVFVNDDHFQLKMAVAILKKDDLNLSTFKSVKDAFAGMSPDDPPNLIITDLHMPEIDGWRFCRLLRSQEYKVYNDVPILVLSATFTGVDAEQITTDLGANAFLSVPYEAAVLRSHIQSLLHGEKPKTIQKVLVVDERVSTANFLKKAFEKHGKNVYVAATGAEAHRLFLRHQPDICILDHHLPDTLGSELLVKFREILPRTVYIMITSDSNPELALDFVLKGADGYVRKPFESAYLIDLCQKVQRERNLIHIEDLLEARTLELRDSEDRHKVLLETTGNGMAIIKDGKVVFANEQVGDLFRCRASEIIGSSFLEYFHPDEVQRIQSQYERYAGGESDLGIIEARLKRANDDYIHVEINGSRYRFEGKNAILISLLDLSARKKAEDQLRQAHKMEAVGRLAGGVAHDFNNILTAINGYAEMIIEGLDANDSLRPNMEVILNAGKRAADLTAQLLAFSRKQVIAPKVIQPNDILKGSQKMLRRIIGEDIDFVFAPGARLWRILADPTQLDQVLMNLAVNARDAMPNGGKLTIETQNVTLDDEYCKSHAGFKPGDYAMMAVMDTGHGMDAETKSKIFEPFFSTKEKDKGTGLGLAMVYGVMKQNNGFINVDSEPGAGTTFKIYFPAHKEKAENTRKSKLADLPEGTETILLVEDEGIVRRLAKTVLERQGYTVIDAPDGKKAYLAYKKHSGDINLLLTDVIMPKMNGRELHKKLLKLNSDLVALFMSGYTEDILAPHGVLGEGAHFLQKPFTIGSLTQKVRQVLND
jgi:PAS domain S-box-containing protein